MYIYIYIYRERERDDLSSFVAVHIDTPPAL